MPHGVTNGRHGTGLTIKWLRQSCDSKAFQEVEEHIGATRVQNMALREVLCRPRTGGAVTSRNLSLSHCLFSLFLALSLSLAMFSLYLPPSRHHYCVADCLTSIFAAYWKTPSWSTFPILQHPSYLYFLQCCLQIPEYGMQKSLYSAKSWKFTAYKRREKKTVVTVGWSEQVWATDQEREEQHLGTQGHCTALVLTELLCKKSCPHLYVLQYIHIYIYVIYIYRQT